MLFYLIEGLERTEIILASTSPRRFELLKSLGLEFKVVASHIKEHVSSKNPKEIALLNARLKGREVAKEHPDSLVISADTVVAIDDQILGKPINENDAFRMLKYLSGRIHTVYTAFGLIYARYEQEIFDIVGTEVSFRKLRDDEIWAYINTGEPFDKAGAYAIQEQGAVFVQQIKGCYSNVVGFPLSRFYVRLEQLFEQLAIQ